MGFDLLEVCLYELLEQLIEFHSFTTSTIYVYAGQCCVTLHNFGNLIDDCLHPAGHRLIVKIIEQV